MYPNYKIENLQFADDLFALCINQSIRRIFIPIQRYPKALRTWLKKFRLEMAAYKCSFSDYIGNVTVLILNNTLKLIMYSDIV